MALIWGTGFEYGIAPTSATITGNGINGNSFGLTGASNVIEIATDPRAGGTYSLRMAQPSAGDCHWRMPDNLGGTNFIVLRCYVKVASFVTSGTAFFVSMDESGDSGTGNAKIGFDSSGNWKAQVGSGTVRTGPLAVTGVWYRLDCKFDMSGTTWALDWMVDGEVQTQASEGGHAADTGTLLYFGNDVGMDYKIDDILVGAASADYPIAPGKVLLAPLDSAASHQSITTTEWQTTSDFSTFTNFTGNNETTSPPLLGPPISTSTPTGFRMNTTGAPAGNGRWGMAAPTLMGSRNAQLVAALIVVREAATGTNNATFRTELSGSTTNIFSGNPGWGTTWNYLGSFMTTGPGSAAWTKANVDAMNFEADSTDASPNIWCQGVVYEVAFPEFSKDPPPPYRNRMHLHTR